MQTQRSPGWAPPIHIVVGGLGLLLALWPAHATAECGPMDVGGCVDGAMYSFWEGLASLGWWFDRTLLMAAFQIDALRWWLVDIAFSSAYAALTAAISPMLAPIATTAVILGCLLFLLLPITGRIRIIDIRHALSWALLAPVLLTASGPLIVQLEQVRNDVGVSLYSAVSALVPGAIFGVAGSDMGTPTALYPAAPCGVALARHSAGERRLDDLAAALLWADAEDIHCPEIGGPGRDIPDAFYEAAPTGAGYAVDMEVSMMPPGTPRAEAVRGMQRGAVRSFVGIIPALLAVLDALVQLLFALSLVALWISFPLGLLFIFFDQHVGTLSTLLRRMLVVLQVSWSSSVLLGLMVACLIAAAELRNGAAYTGFAIGGGALVVYVLRVALDTFIACVRTVSDVVTVVTGLSPAQAATTATQTASTALTLGAAAATGGATAGLLAAAAYRQTGNASYTAGTVLGQLRPIAQLGEVAQTMGVLAPESALATGLYAGQRSQHSLQAARLQIQSDAQRPDATGATLRDHADERRLAADLRRQQRPTVIQELEQGVVAGRQLGRYVLGGQISADMERLSTLAPAITSAAWQRASAHMRYAQQAIQQQAGADAGPLRTMAASAQLIDARLHRGGRGQVIQLDPRGRVTFQPPPASAPAHAMQLPAQNANIPRLLTLGYAVQEVHDQVVIWRVHEHETPAPRRATRPAPGSHTAPVPPESETAGRNAPADAAAERERLIRAGAITAATTAPAASTRTASQATQAAAPESPSLSGGTGCAEVTPTPPIAAQPEASTTTSPESPTAPQQEVPHG